MTIKIIGCDVESSLAGIGSWNSILSFKDSSVYSSNIGFTVTTGTSAGAPLATVKLMECIDHCHGIATCKSATLNSG